jgi:hypothetical protein
MNVSDWLSERKDKRLKLLEKDQELKKFKLQQGVLQEVKQEIYLCKVTLMQSKELENN